MHPLEIKGIADGDVAVGIRGLSPIENKQLTRDEITRCEKNSKARLKRSKLDIPVPSTRTKGPRYTPLAKRQDKPDAIAWLIKHYPSMKESQIVRLIGTTKNTIKNIRERTHWNSANLMPRDPVLLGLCSQTDLNAAIAKVETAKANELKAAAAFEDASAQPGIKSNDYDAFLGGAQSASAQGENKSSAELSNEDIKVILPQDLFKK